MSENNKKRIGVYFYDETINLCDAGVALTNAKSRSEFLTNAVEFYTSVLMKNHTAKVLTPALESVIRGTVGVSEDRIAKVIFKNAVSMTTMMHMMAEVYDIDPKRIAYLQNLSYHEITKFNGKFKFEDVFKYDD